MAAENRHHVLILKRNQEASTAITLHTSLNKIEFLHLQSANLSICLVQIRYIKKR